MKLCGTAAYALGKPEQQHVTYAPDPISNLAQGVTDAASINRRTERKAMVLWAALLNEAMKKPGFIHEVYSRFHPDIEMRFFNSSPLYLHILKSV